MEQSSLTQTAKQKCPDHRSSIIVLNLKWTTLQNCNAPAHHSRARCAQQKKKLQREAAAFFLHRKRTM
jgi:hypothetical protein